MFHSQDIQQMMSHNSAAFDMMQANLHQQRQYQGFAYGAQDPYGIQTSMNVGAGASNVGKGMLAAAGIGTFVAGFGSSAFARGVAGLDPFMAGMSGFGRAARGAVGLGAGDSLLGAGWNALKTGNLGALGRMGMGGIVGGAVAAAPMAALWAGGRFLASNIAAGGREEMGMQQMISRNFDFYNPAARSGRGFEIGQMSQITDTLRDIAKSDPFTDLSQIMRIFGDLSQKGHLLHATNPGEVSRKFKQTTDTLRDIAKTIGTTMEGAIQFFDESRKMGFTTRSDILANVRNQIVGAGGGLSSRGIAAAQMEGSQMAHAQGYGMREGAILASKSIQSVRDLYTKGLISEGDLRNMSGGQIGEQAYATVGRTLQQAAYNLSHSGIGRVIYAGLAEKDEQGKFTGRIDKGLLDQFRSGGLSASDVRGLARKNLASRGAALSFLNMEKDIAGEFAAGAGAEGWGGVMSVIQSVRPGLSKDAVKLLMKQMTGLGRREVETIMKLYNTMDQRILESKERATQLLIKKREEAEIAQNYSIQGLWTQFKSGLHAVVNEPLHRMGASIATRAQGLTLSVRDRILGRTMSASMTQDQANMINAHAMGMDIGASDVMGVNQINDVTGGALTNMNLAQNNEYMAQFGRSRTSRASRVLGLIAERTNIFGGVGSMYTGRGVGLAGLFGDAAAGDSVFSNMPGREALRAHHSVSNLVNNSLSLKVEEHTKARFEAQLGMLSMEEAAKLDNIKGQTPQETMALRSRAALAMFDKHGMSFAGEYELGSKIRGDKDFKSLQAYYGRSEVGATAQSEGVRALAMQRMLQDSRFGEGKGGIAQMGQLSAAALQAEEDKARQSVASALGPRSIWKYIGETSAAFGTTGAVAGAVGGSVGTPIGSAVSAGILGAAGLVVGALTGIGRYATEEPYDQRQLENLMKDNPDILKGIQIAAKGGSGSREAYEFLRSKGLMDGDSGKKLRMVLDRVAAMDDAGRKGILKSMGTIKRAGLTKSLEMYRIQQREAAEDLLGLRPGAEKALGSELYEQIYGKEGVVESMRRPMNAYEMLASNQDIATKQDLTAGEIARKLDSEGMGGKTAQFLRKSTMGLRLLNAARYQTKEGRDTLTSLVDASGGDAGALAASLSQRFNLDKKGLDKNILQNLMASDDVAGLQKYLGRAKLGPQQQTTMSVLTQIKSGTERMAKAAEVLVDVMINAGGNNKNKEMQARYGEYVKGNRKQNIPAVDKPG